MKCDNCMLECRGNSFSSPYWEYRKENKENYSYSTTTEYYCEHCVSAIRDLKIEENQKIPNRKNSYNTVHNWNIGLQDEIKKNKEKFEKELAKKNERITELEFLLKDKEIADLKEKIKVFEAKLASLEVTEKEEITSIVSATDSNHSFEKL